MRFTYFLTNNLDTHFKVTRIYAALGRFFQMMGKLVLVMNPTTGGDMKKIWVEQIVVWGYDAHGSQNL